MMFGLIHVHSNWPKRKNFSPLKRNSDRKLTNSLMPSSYIVLELGNETVLYATKDLGLSIKSPSS